MLIVDSTPCEVGTNWFDLVIFVYEYQKVLTNI